MKNPLLTGLAALIVAIGMTVVFTDDNGPNGNHKTVTIRVGTDSQRGADATVVVPGSAVAQAQASDLGHHDGLKSESPPGLTSAQANRLQDAQDAAARNDQLPIVTPDAAPSQAGCRSEFVGSYSSRRGVAPRLFVLHYTVSPNRVGWSDVNAVVAEFANPAFQASSNYVIDGEGHCAYIVRESDKSWTEAAGNSFSISAEVINTGHEPVYIAPAGLKVLARVISDALRRWNIPVRVGKVSGCIPVRSGIVTHQMFGLCGGGHVDITPYPISTVVQAVLSEREREAQASVSRLDVLRCTRLNRWRAAGRPVKGTHANVLRKHTLAAHHVQCDPGKPARK